MEENDSFYFGEDDQVQTDVNSSQQSVFDNYQNEDSPEPSEEPQYDEEGNLITSEENDYISQLLLAKGIDRNNIEITEEDGTVTNVTFDDLSNEDKLALLSEEMPEDTGITDKDIEILNYFRANRINSLQEFANGIAQQAVANYIASQQNAPTSDIDSYNDDEIIAYDLINKFGDNMSDEEIDAEIERLKEDEDAYAKKVNLLRTYYRNEEEAQRKLYEDDQAAQRQANTEAFRQAYGQAAANLNTIQGIDLEDADKQDLLDFVLTKDSFGKTEFSKALDDPETVLKMAWFLKNGEDAAEATRNYFAQLLAKERASKPATRPQPRAVSRPNGGSNANSSKQNNSFKF